VAKDLLSVNEDLLEDVRELRIDLVSAMSNSNNVAKAIKLIE